MPCGFFPLVVLCNSVAFVIVTFVALQRKAAKIFGKKLLLQSRSDREWGKKSARAGSCLCQKCAEKVTGKYKTLRVPLNVMRMFWKKPWSIQKPRKRQAVKNSRVKAWNEKSSLVIGKPKAGIENNIMESLILAQNERWRRVLSMQVERYWGACFPRKRRTGE